VRNVGDDCGGCPWEAALARESEIAAAPAWQVRLVRRRSHNVVME
jgi:hypothetical protein